MQCDTGRADESRRCRWCHFLSCEACMPDPKRLCLHCAATRRDISPSGATADEESVI